MDERIAALTAQIEKLQAENTFLKCLLDEVGISYVLPASKPTAEISKQLARRFYSYFWGRTDVYSKRSVNKTTGKAGYYPQCENLWKDGICPKKSGKKVKCGDCANRKWRQLEAEQIMAHLRGEKPDGSDVIGIYPLFPDGTCRLLVFDFDNHEKGAETLDFGNPDTRWMEEVDALRQVCEGNKVPCLVERSRSGRGGHLWIFFASAVEAALARRFGMALLQKGAETVNLKSFRFYDRMLPAQDSAGDGELGYLIALPLQGQALKKDNSAFVDKNWNAYPDQWEVLFAVKKLSAQTMESCIKRWNVPETDRGSFLPEDTKPWERKTSFHTEDVDGQLCMTLANRIYIETGNAYERLRRNENRNGLIVSDVKKALEAGRTPVILTRFTDQAAILYEMLKDSAQKPFLLTGEMPKKEREAAIRQMAEVMPQESMLLVATGQLVGEGFDYPRLDTLFLATPVSWKGVVEQYAGRLHRDHPGKKNVFIYDYVDSHIPVFDKMYAKRLKTYKRIGYTLYAPDTPEKQAANAIFDSDTYRPVFEQDLREAVETVLISSPTLSRKRVENLVELLLPAQEQGLKAAVITWHPDVYRYGNDENRLLLLESLRTAGFEIQYAEETCQHFAVIDEKIVWYGSMNLLSRDNVEDNIMRLESREVAEELLGMMHFCE